MQYQYRETMNMTNFLSQFKNKNITNVKRIAKNTFTYCINNEQRIRLYETDILIEKDNYIILNTDGFKTRLTMNRLNDSLNKIFSFRIYIKINKGIWYLISKDNNSTRFFDGIKISKENGEILNKNKTPNFDKVDKKNKKIIGLINKYCLEIKNMEKLPEEYKGDCYYCQFEMKDYDHLLLHLKQKYVMKSLILNALKENGYQFPLFIYTNDEPDRKLIISAVKKYFKKYLIIK